MGIHWERDLVGELELDGKQIFNRDNPLSLDGINYFKDLSSPTEVHVAIDRSVEAPALSFTFISQNLPINLISNYEERNEDMMPKPHWFSNASLWQTTVHLDTLAQASE